tara:strand:+ start:889 stop:1500 length:612 start_codon:yes stop_codon:yes gene_type:complete
MNNYRYVDTYQGYKVNFSQSTTPKGYHKMPDGTIMKDSDHVNFAQPTAAQYNAANILRIDKSLYQYPQQIGLSSEKSDSDIWKWLGTYVTGNSGSNSQGSWNNNPNALMPLSKRNESNITRLDEKNTMQDENIVNNQRQIQEVNSRLSEQLIQAGQDVTAVGEVAGAGNTQAGLSGLLGGIGIGSLAVLGLGAYLLTRGGKLL